MKHWIIAAVVLIGLPACSSEGDVNLGEDNPATLGEKLEDYSGRWQGYAEAYEFSSGSDRMVLRIDEDGDGYATFGDGTAPPPATNPDVGYPAGLSPDDLISAFQLQFRGGVQYPLHDVLVEDRRIRLRVSSMNLWDDWCELQTPVLVVDSNATEPQYGVLPVNGFSRGEGGCFIFDDTAAEPVQVDCGKAVLHFTHVCACTASACRANDDAETGAVELDAALESLGEELVGTLTIAGRVTVRLSRQ